MTTRILGSRIGHTIVNSGDETHDPETPALAEPRLEGDDRASRGLTPSVIDRLLALPHEWLDLARTIEDARNVLVDAFAREVWENTAPVSNQPQQNTFGSGCYLLAVPGHASQAIELRNVLIGTSAAGAIQLIALRAKDLIGQLPAYRILATVRTTANTLSVPLPAKVKLEPEENLILLYLTGASVNFDLSAEYRVLRG